VDPSWPSSQAADLLVWQHRRRCLASACHSTACWVERDIHLGKNSLLGIPENLVLDKKQSELRYLKGGTVRVGGGTRIGLGVFNPRQSAGNHLTPCLRPGAELSLTTMLHQGRAGVSDLLGQATENKKEPEQKKEEEVNSISVSDVEEVAVGKEAVKHVEGANVL